MQSRQLGKTSLHITPISLGTWAIGGWMWGTTNEEDSIAAIQTSIENGIALIDTAPIYGCGYSETIVGKAIKNKRDKVFIATKCGLTWDKSAEPLIDASNLRQNSSPNNIRDEWEQSVKRLGIDVIDLYQIHWPDAQTPIEKSWEAMANLKEQGKVRAIGVSNYNLAQLKKAHSVYPVDSLQAPYSLIRRGLEKDLIPFCIENQISILAYSPLERGLLTGKIALDKKFPKGDHRDKNPTFSLEHRKQVLAALEIIRPIAEHYKSTIAQAIIQSTINQPGITTALIGARNATQALENATALALRLTDNDNSLIVKALEQISLK